MSSRPLRARELKLKEGYDVTQKWASRPLRARELKHK